MPEPIEVSRKWSARWKALAQFRGWPASRHEQTRRALQAEKDAHAKTKEEVEWLKRLQAKYEEHERDHAEAVDDCRHDEKTWVCCGACHCVAIQRAEAAEARAAAAEKEIERLVLTQTEAVRKAVEPLEAQIAQLKHELEVRR